MWKIYSAVFEPKGTEQVHFKPTDWPPCYAKITNLHLTYRLYKTRKCYLIRLSILEMWLAWPPQVLIYFSLPPKTCLLPGNSFRQLLQSLLQLQREFLVALLTHWLHVKLHKLVPEEESVTATVTVWMLRCHHSQYVRICVNAMSTSMKNGLVTL